MGKIPVIHSAVVRLVWLHFETFPTNEQFVTLEIEAIRLSIPGHIHDGTSNQSNHNFYIWRHKLSDKEEFTLLPFEKWESLTHDNHQILISSFKFHIHILIKKPQMYSAKSPTTVGPASVSWARDLARATRWHGLVSSAAPSSSYTVTTQTRTCHCSALSSMF